MNLYRTRTVRSLSALIIGSIIAAGASADIDVTRSSYRSIADSPFLRQGDTSKRLLIEDFEDGSFDLAGVSYNVGVIRGPGAMRDSVDGDDAQIDGFGSDGWSLAIPNRASRVAFSFDAGVLGGLPVQVGFAWTDGRPGTKYILRAWDGEGNRLDRLPVILGDRSRRGSTAEDRFMAFTFDEGIGRVAIRSRNGGFELDHIQFREVTTVPAPAALAALSALGLVAGVGQQRRRID